MANNNKKTPTPGREKRVSLIYWERVCEMHLRVPVEIRQSVHTRIEWYVYEPVRFLVHFSVPSEF